jgi:class 3 adenylate cyclase/tetratricopeptide (TPR) repeat protein
MEAERRQVTVLFSDMVGFTTFSEKSGEEAAFTLMRSLSKLMDEAVRGQGGVVQGFTGDGIMAVFGAPVAFEDAPLRACRAALSILERLKAAGPSLEAKHGVRPQLRIGLNTGAAVVGQVQEGADAGVTVLGDTVNFAARLQSLAAPGAVSMSEVTYRLLQGLVDASFTGEHTIKGKAERQKVYRLEAVRHGVTRFEAAVSRGLTAFVGREHELEVLARGLDEARSGLRIIDLAAEPGMGKSRLLHEFRRRIGKDRAFVLSGSCSPDGQQTPFLPFIEVVRGSFRLSAGEPEKEVAQKLEIGLTSLGLDSTRNLGLLLHLLGLKVPDDALKGLDGVLIGLRTRELLQKLLGARCRLSPVVMLIEDLHWIDSASEELLGKIAGSDARLPLVLLTTRRPEYAPSWLDRKSITTLELRPLAAGEIRSLVQARFGVHALPEALGRAISERVEGNPLFAEEIVSFLAERGILRSIAGKLEFDPNAVATALPGTLQSVLTARVDRFNAQDRTLLQAASVIGRQFDAQLLVAAVGEVGDIESRLAAMQKLDLIYIDERSAKYVFKHALIQDALYESLLSEPRAALHSKVADEIERRSGNRLAEVAELLAHHYSQTGNTAKAFLYLSMAGDKSLGVYSLDDAAGHFAAALALLDKEQECASDDQVVEFLASYLLLLTLSEQIKVSLKLLDRYFARVDRLKDNPTAVIVRHHFAHALLMNRRFQDAATMHRATSAIAERLGDGRSKAYALASDVFITSVIEPKTDQEFELLRNEAAAIVTQDAYVLNQVRFVIGFEEVFRGRMNDARASAHKLLEVGRLLNDPRSTGFGLWLMTIVALVSDSYAEALEYSEQALATVITPVDRNLALSSKGSALVLLGRVGEGLLPLEESRLRCIERGSLYPLTGTDALVGVAQIFKGHIAEGIRTIESAIATREAEGFSFGADWARLNLAEVYLQIVAGREKPPLKVLLNNLPIILKVTLTASGRIVVLMSHVLRNPRFDPNGHFAGRAKMILGLLYKAKKKPALAVQHLTEAKRIFLQFGQSPMLARVDAALAELGQ